MEKLIQKTYEALQIIEDLITQRDNATSSTLSDLLNKEITAYVKLNSIFGECQKLYAAMLGDLSNRIKRDFDDFDTYKSMMQKISSDLDLSYSSKNLSDILLLRNAKLFLSQYRSADAQFKLTYSNSVFLMEVYCDAISRNFKDWKTFVSKLTECVADSVLDEIPVISELKGFYDVCKNISDLISEYESNGTNYSNEDKKLREIELHIETMEVAIYFFTQIREVLTSQMDIIAECDNCKNSDL